MSERQSRTSKVDDAPRHLPESPPAVESAQDLLAYVPEFVRSILTATAPRLGDPARDWIVVDGRHGLESKRRTLDELAPAIGVTTRERPRQIEGKATSRVRRIIASGYRGPGFVVREDFAAALERVYGCGPAGDRLLLSDDDLFDCLAIDGGLGPFGLNRLKFLFQLRDVIRLDGNGARRPAMWSAGHLAHATRLAEVADRIDDVLCTRGVTAMTELDITVELNRSARSSARVSVADVQLASSLCRTIERLEDGRLRGRFEWLTGRANQAYRLIEDAGTPVHRDVLVREINARSMTELARLDSRNLANQMTDDDRLIPIGKSGEWGIRGLHDEGSEGILTLMRAFLTRTGQPQTEEAIYEFVSAKRRVARASIAAYLSTSDAFVRLPDGRWAFPHWAEAKGVAKPTRRPRRKRKPTLRDLVTNDVFATLVALPNHEMALNALIEGLIKAFHRPSQTFYQYVNAIPFLEKVRVGRVVSVRLKQAVAKPGTSLTAGEVRAMIASGESPVVEFKSTLRWDVRNGVERKELQKQVTKSIAAFLNGIGGHLLIGVEDNRNLFGIEKDMDLLADVGQGGSDGFAQTVANVIKSQLGPEMGPLFSSQFLTLDGKTLYVVAVRPSPNPVYLTDGGKRQLFVRLETTTQPLDQEQADRYTELRWGAGALGSLRNG